MKTHHIKVIASIFILCYAFSLNGQVSIPNGSFENWTTYNLPYPAGYPYHCHLQTILKNTPPLLEKVNDAYHGQFAVKLSTYISASDTIFGHFLNVNPEQGPLFTWHDGFPINQIPTGIRGYYKGNFVNNDSALILVSFSKNGMNIGMYFFLLGQSSSTYAPFQFSFNPPLSQTPDSIQIGFASSNPFSLPQHGSWVILDSISLLGVTNQPAQLNGSFENWEIFTFDKLDNWYVISHPICIQKTTDAIEGSYAVQLKTLTQDSSSYYAGQISTGYWVFDGQNYVLTGGYPFTNQTDTLIFSYKYLPTADDTASIILVFKNSGSTIWWQHIFINDQPAYTTTEIPINLPTTPDTVIVIIQSSIWNHQNSPAYNNSTLIIDHIYFKSQIQPTGTDTKPVLSSQILLYPNPAKDVLYVNTELHIHRISILSANFQLINVVPPSEHNAIINLSSLPTGNYYLKIESSQGIIVKPFQKL